MNLTARLAKPIAKLKSKLNSDFIRNLGWLGGAELINRVFRLATTVILARCLSPYDYGLAALVLTVYEFTQVLTRIGIAGKVIQADQEKLESICNGAYWLNWLVCFGVFVIQCVVAFPVAWFYHDNQLIQPICLMAIVYLITPIGRIQAALIQRENRLKITAISGAIQLAVGNILTAIFALMGLGMWAIVLPRIITAPIDAIVCIYNHPWRRTKGFTTERWWEIFKFGVNFIVIGMLATLRNNLDYLIIGRFLGVKELGIYFFAFNAGLGISLSVIQSITTALYPHICAVRSNWVEFERRYFSGLKTIAFIIFPLVLLQSSLAPIYVPIIFGQKWVVAIPILILICLSAIPRPFFLAATNLFAAIDKPNLSLIGNLLFTVIFAIGLLIGVKWQALGVAISVLITHIIFMPFFVIWAGRYVFSANRSEPAKEIN
ncbi:lipopolysaccharide biosynthesis protein [Argonema antarcticum]|uniref:lipopolysaccharide biosynthesis protein n=1 Tax=Argonema antarcticum TaxID=2942763 RepID=UPI0020129277|nr:lipopolysaccharide biosynthesis protein [Argonema antarcticum]MCL1474291.1 lipopolysaccharide biosynthesis protein [Argonema antarcticum A004/B2]